MIFPTGVQDRWTPYSSVKCFLHRRRRLIQEIFRYERAYVYSDMLVILNIHKL